MQSISEGRSSSHNMTCLHACKVTSCLCVHKDEARMCYPWDEGSASTFENNAHENEAARLPVLAHSSHLES
eukprot:1156580-Pelagomonas_calceolata.AAC.5